MSSEAFIKYANDIIKQFGKSDFTIICKDGTIYETHRQLLAARCPYFKMMFNSGMADANRTSLYIDTVSSVSVANVLDYIKFAQMEISNENRPDLNTLIEIYSLLDMWSIEDAKIEVMNEIGYQIYTSFKDTIYVLLHNTFNNVKLKEYAKKMMYNHILNLTNEKDMPDIDLFSNGDKIYLFDCLMEIHTNEYKANKDVKTRTIHDSRYSQIPHFNDKEANCEYGFLKYGYELENQRTNDENEWGTLIKKIE